MPLLENIDGTLWIDINEMTEVDKVQAKLLVGGVRVAAVIPDPGCDVAVKEVQWGQHLSQDRLPQWPGAGDRRGSGADPRRARSRT